MCIDLDRKRSPELVGILGLFVPIRGQTILSAMLDCTHCPRYCKYVN